MPGTKYRLHQHSTRWIHCCPRWYLHEPMAALQVFRDFRQLPRRLRCPFVLYRWTHDHRLLLCSPRSLQGQRPVHHRSIWMVLVHRWCQLASLRWLPRVSSDSSNPRDNQLTCSGFAVNAPGFVASLSTSITVPDGALRIYYLVSLLFILPCVPCATLELVHDRMTVPILKYTALTISLGSPEPVFPDLSTTFAVVSLLLLE